MRYPPPIKSRIFDNIIKTDKRCWEWQGSLNTSGYGIISYQCKTRILHRLYWELVNGEITTNCLLHKCDNRKCINPEHLYEGTKKQNSNDCLIRNRNGQKNKTHCKRDHKYDELNTRMYNTSRICRACDRLRYAGEGRNKPKLKLSNL